LTREFLKQKKVREESWEEANTLNDLTRVRAIQVQTIKDLEDCLRDYEKTENALNEL
jgi:hypothetical protein